MKYIDLTEEQGGGGVADDKFIANNTIITVGASGADFTTLQDALNFLTGKFSSGVVTIQLATETFNISNRIIINNSFNFQKLIIKGNGTSNSILNFNFDLSYNGYFTVNTETSITLKDFAIQGFAKISSRGLQFEKVANVTVDNVNATTCDIGLFSTDASHTYILKYGANDCNYGLYQGCGNSYCSYGVITLTDIVTGFIAGNGGVISLNSPTINSTNVTNLYGITKNTISNTGGLILTNV